MQFNQSMLIGRVTADATVTKVITHANEEKNVTNFRIAVPRDYKKDGEEMTDFFKVSMWGITGERAGKWLKKGMLVLVVGSIYTDEREIDIEGHKVKTYSFEIKADKFSILEPRRRKKAES